MIDPPNSYMSIKQASDGIYKDKGSKFIAKAFPVKDLEEIKNILVQLKLEHPKARHVCYAYRLVLHPRKPDLMMMENPQDCWKTDTKYPIFVQRTFLFFSRYSLFWGNIIRRSRINSCL